MGSNTKTNNENLFSKLNVKIKANSSAIAIKSTNKLTLLVTANRFNKLSAPLFKGVSCCLAARVGGR